MIHLQTPSDPIQTLPDTIQTPQDIGIFMQYRALEEKAISEYHGLLYLFANRFGIDASPDTLRHHLDIIQTRAVEVPKKKADKKAPATGAAGAF